MFGGMFVTQNKLGYWSVTRPFLCVKGRQHQTRQWLSVHVKLLSVVAELWPNIISYTSLYSIGRSRNLFFSCIDPGAYYALVGRAPEAYGSRRVCVSVCVCVCMSFVHISLQRLKTKR